MSKHVASGLALIVLLLAGCSTTIVQGSTTGRSPCNGGLGCGANATCNSAVNPPVCQCFTNDQQCPVAVDGGDAGAGAVECANLESDPSNCGACGAVCGSSQSCLGGVCVCQLMSCGSTDAGSVCTDVENDPSNCGACGKTCQKGEDCALGICHCSTAPTIAECITDAGPTCIDLSTDDENCGGCGMACADDQHCAPVGSTGQCVCDEGGPGTVIERCGGTCTDTTLDPFNCGGCGTVCVSGSCLLGDAGQGVCNCPPPYQQCGPDCVDPYSDVNHCGGCQNDCTLAGIGLITELACNLGHCYCGPTSLGTICPNGVCANLEQDVENCGACGNACIAPASDCINGICACPDAESLCGNPDAGIALYCQDTSQNDQSCGTCGNVCQDTFADKSGCRFGICTCSVSQSSLCADVPSRNPSQPTCTCQSDTDAGEAACAAPSFAMDIYPLLSRQAGAFGCAASGCHSGSTPSGDLAFLDRNGSLDAGMAYAELLGLGASAGGDAGVLFCDAGVPAYQPSQVCACYSRVVPGNPFGSYLVDALTNQIPCDAGASMPLDDAGGWSPLDRCSQQLVQQWIASGANP